MGRARWPSGAVILMVFSFVFLKAVGYFSANNVSLVVDNQRDLGAISLGTHIVDFEIFNSSTNKSKTLLNISYTCGKSGCISVEGWNDQSVTIPPGGKISLPCRVALFAPGPFEFGLPVFVEDGGLREISLVVKGTSVSATKQSRDSPIKD